MGHPTIENRTPFAFEPVFIADEDMRPVVVTLVKATFRFDLDGQVQLADEQIPVNFAGEFWSDAPVSSYKYEPEVALLKPATDVVLIGHARPSASGQTQIDVGIKVGPVQKLARVFGERFWVRTKDAVVMSRPGALQPTPLIWENAFGGIDAARSAPERMLLEPRNPVGTGFGQPLARDGERLKLPNIEDPQHLIRDYGEVVPPCGFGFTSPNWYPRASFAGTYDETWNKTRKPLLPADFDRRFFNAAAPGLIAPGHLRGNEPVVILNATSAPRVDFRLPAYSPPLCRVAVRGEPDVTLSTVLDTVIVNADEQLLMLLWRAHTGLPRGPHDVAAIEVQLE